MSGAHITEEKLEGVYCNSTKDLAFINLLKNYLKVLKGLLGPKGGTLLIEHQGGINSFVNSSKEFIQKTRPHHPCLKLINTLMEAQNSMYGSGGLYVGVLILTLYVELLELEIHEGVNNCVIREKFADISELVLTKMEEKPSEIVTKLDVGNLTHVMALVKSVVGSKNIGLSKSEKDHLSAVIVEAFLKTVDGSCIRGSEGAFGEVLYVSVDGRPSSEACVLPGVLYKLGDGEDLILQRIIERINSHTGDDQLNSAMLEKLRLYSRNVTFEEGTKGVRVLLFNIPLAFENEEGVKLEFRSSETGRENSIEMFDKIVCEKLGEFVKSHRIDIVACQKVISPVIQHRLNKLGVLALERLGTKTTKAVEKISGCKSISNLLELLNNCDDSFEHCIGSLEHLDTVEVSGEAYLQLTSTREPLVTLMLASTLPVMTETLQGLAEEGIATLRRVASGGVASCGAGCGEAWLALWLSTVTPQQATVAHTKPQHAAESSGFQTTSNSFHKVRTTRQNPSNSSDGNSSSSAHLSIEMVYAAVAKGLLKVALALGRTNAEGDCDLFSMCVDQRSGHLVWVDPGDCGSEAAMGGSTGVLSGYQQDLDRNRYFDGPTSEDRNSELSEESSLPEKCSEISDSNQPKGFSESGCNFSSSSESSASEVSQEHNISEMMDDLITDVSSADSMATKCCCGCTASSGDLVPIKDSLDFTPRFTPVLKPPKTSLKSSLQVTDGSVLDEFYSKLNALRLVFEGLAQLLELELCVFDR